MFTVKVIDGHGREDICEADNVWAVSAKLPGTYIVYCEGRQLGSGKPSCFMGENSVVYVMNDQGRTVARYMLSDPGDAENAPPS